jgi:hypothetical protein
MTTDARLCGRGGGDPKGVSAGGGISKPTPCTRIAPSHQKCTSGHRVFRLGGKVEVLVRQRLACREPSFSPSLWRQIGRKRNQFRFLDVSKGPPGLRLVGSGGGAFVGPNLRRKAITGRGFGRGRAGEDAPRLARTSTRRRRRLARSAPRRGAGGWGAGGWAEAP